MIISKYFHSCLLVEENGRKLLIDPGAFSFIEKEIKPEDIGTVDVIVITHKHPDHYFPDALRIHAKNAVIIADGEICALLAKEGIAHETITEGEIKTIAGFTIQALEAPHECIPAEIPHHLAFLINKKLLHPGDSLSVAGAHTCKILALPVAGPWLKLTDALAFAKKLAPAHVIPVHDAIIKDFMLLRIYAMCQNALEKESIAFHPLRLGDALEV